MRSIRGLPLGVIVVLAIGIATAVAVGTAKPACACVAPPTSPVDGVVTEVNSTGLTDIKDFTIHTADAAGGMSLTFELGPLENATEFSPGHLKEHQATGTPIRVYFTRSSTGVLTVYRLEDAPSSSSSP